MTPPLTVKHVLHQISANGCIPQRQQATPEQLAMLARLIVESGCRWDPTERRGYTKWQANMVIRSIMADQAKSTEAA